MVLVVPVLLVWVTRLGCREGRGHRGGRDVTGDRDSWRARPLRPTGPEVPRVASADWEIGSRRGKVNSACT